MATNAALCIDVASQWEAAQLVAALRELERKLRAECPIGRTRLEERVRKARLHLQREAKQLPGHPSKFLTWDQLEQFKAQHAEKAKTDL